MVTRTITKRILRLRDGTVEIGNGNLSFRIEENTNDEMGTLAREFNLMSDRLKDKND
jgi:methyl-accepting chemotaxis protein